MATQVVLEHRAVSIDEDDEFRGDAGAQQIELAEHSPDGLGLAGWVPFSNNGLQFHGGINRGFAGADANFHLGVQGLVQFSPAFFEGPGLREDIAPGEMQAVGSRVNSLIFPIVPA